MDMLRITNLKKHFGDKEVLTGLNLSVPINANIRMYRNDHLKMYKITL